VISLHRVIKSIECAVGGYHPGQPALHRSKPVQNSLREAPSHPDAPVQEHVRHPQIPIRNQVTTPRRRVNGGTAPRAFHAVTVHLALTHHAEHELRETYQPQTNPLPISN
jgi:hypothetical protein